MGREPVQLSDHEFWEKKNWEHVNSVTGNLNIKFSDGVNMFSLDQYVGFDQHLIVGLACENFTLKIAYSQKIWWTD